MILNEFANIHLQDFRECAASKSIELLFEIITE